MPENRIYSFIGLARKAGALVSGENAVENAVRYGKACLVVIAFDASQNTAKKVTDCCAASSVKTMQFGSKSGLGGILGREMYSVIAITDKRFSDRLKEMIMLESNHDNTVNGERH